MASHSPLLFDVLYQALRFLNLEQPLKKMNLTWFPARRPQQVEEGGRQGRGGPAPPHRGIVPGSPRSSGNSASPASRSAASPSLRAEPN